MLSCKEATDIAGQEESAMKMQTNRNSMEWIDLA
jgi:hypothetical protein